MFEAWGEASVPASNDGQLSAAIASFHALIESANAIEEFDELITGGLFKQVRSLKWELGEQFYRAEITAAAIECNTVIVNRFCDLVASEGSQVDELPAAYRNLATILSDTSAISFVSGALNELQLAELEEKAQSGAHLARLMKLLRASNEHQEAGSPTAAK
jgi:hypothetical protein